MNKKIEEIKKKYLTYKKTIQKKNTTGIQSEINKINSIHKKLKDRKISIAELNRLEFHLELLIKDIKELK